MYEPLPEVCSDISLRAMIKSPRRWLQKEMGRSHAALFRDGNYGMFIHWDSSRISAANGAGRPSTASANGSSGR